MRSVQTSVTSLKTGAARLLRALNQNRTPVVITQSGQPRGVLLDFQSYEELKEAVLLLKLLAQSEEDIRTGRTVPQKQAFSAARARLSDR